MSNPMNKPKGCKNCGSTMPIYKCSQPNLKEECKHNPIYPCPQCVKTWMEDTPPKSKDKGEWGENLRSLWQTTRENEGKYAKIKAFIKAEKEKSYEEGLKFGKKGMAMKVDDNFKEFLQTLPGNKFLEEARTSTASQIIEEIDENIATTQRTHRVGSHSDDYGGDSDLPCDCDKEQVEHQVSALKSLKKKIISKFKLE